ncbi:MAG: chromate transporter, partial [Hyphomicrobiaceae bacterium]|nr:chromate transporter [Hyphomicrobiaceae bacterium]
MPRGTPRVRRRRRPLRRLRADVRPGSDRPARGRAERRRGPAGVRPSPHPPAAGAKGPDSDAPPRPSFGELVRTFAVVGVLSFGGPAGQIALMHRMLVEERRWIGEARFLRALNFCMLLPGPEAMQLATYAGWLTHGVRGGLVAGTLFVLPGFVVVTALSAAYAAFGEDPRLSGVLLGLKA